MKPKGTLFIAFERVLELFCTLFGLALGVLILLMCVDIAIRNVRLGWLFEWLPWLGELIEYFDIRIGSLPWLIELTEYMLYGGTFLAAPWVLRQGAHVRVDVVLSMLPKRKAVRLEQFIDLIGLGVALVLLFYGAYAVVDAWRGDLVARKTWNFDEWLLLLPIPISALLLAIEFVLRIARVQGVVAGDHDPAKRASI